MRVDRSGFLWILVILVALQSGCRDSSSSFHGAQPDDILDAITIVNDAPQCDEPFTPLSGNPVSVIGTLEGLDGHDLHRAFRARMLSDGDVAVLNASTAEVRIFDQNGLHIRSVGGEGDGPGELRNAVFLDVTSDNKILVAGARGNSISSFSADGQFVGMTSSDDALTPSFLQEFLVLPDGGMLYQAFDVGSLDQMGLDPQRTRYHLIRVGPDGGHADTLSVWPGTDLVYIAGTGPSGPVDRGRVPVRSLFAPSTRISGNVQAQRFVVGDQREPVLQLLDASGALVREVHWNLPGRQATTNELEILIEAQIGPENMRARQLDAMRSLPGWRELPAFRSLAVGSDGILWVERHPLPDDESGLWWVFDREGRWTGGVELPREAEILDAGVDYLIMRERDELDVERITVWRLQWPDLDCQ